MKVKQLIAELQKFNPELEVFFEEFLQLRHIDHLRKTKVMVDKETHFGITGLFGNITSWESDRFNKKAMNSKFPQAVLISVYPNFRSKKKKA